MHALLAATASADRARHARDGSVDAPNAAPDVTLRAARCAPALAADAPARHRPCRRARRLRAAGAIDDAAYAERRAAYEDAKRTASSSAAAQVELGGVVSDARGHRRARAADAPRGCAPLFLTLQRNREYWTTRAAAGRGPARRLRRAPSSSGSTIPGQGLQFHPLGNFGKLNALWSAASATTTALGAAARRAAAARRPSAPAALAWEYYFPFDGGRPPWVSRPRAGHRRCRRSRARRTRLERQAEVLAGRAARPRRSSSTPPPAGVRVAGRRRRALRCSTRSRRELRDPQRLRPVARRPLRLRRADAATPTRSALFADGDARPRARGADATTPAPGRCTRAASITHESDLGYHTLLRDFLTTLCDRTGDASYCGAEQHFTEYLIDAAGAARSRTRDAARRQARASCASALEDLARRRCASRAATAAGATRAAPACVGHGTHDAGLDRCRARPGDYDGAR